MPGPFTTWTAPNFRSAPSPETSTFDELSRDTEQYGLKEGCGLSDKKDGALLFVGAYCDGATSKSAANLDLSRLPPIAIVDLDALGPIPPHTVVQTVGGLLPRVRADLWTTYSHDPQGTRMRVLIALTRGPASAEEHAAVWASLNGKGGLLHELGTDQTVSDLTRGQAAPASPPGRVPEYFRIEGGALDTDWLLAFARHRNITVPPVRTARSPSLATKAAAGAQRVPDENRRSLTREELASFAADGPEPAASDARAVLEGRPWGAGLHTREPRLSGLALWLMRRFPHLDPDATADLFEASCAAVEAEDMPLCGRRTEKSWVAAKLRSKIKEAARIEAQQAAEQAEARAYAGDAASYIERARAARAGRTNAHRIIKCAAPGSGGGAQASVTAHGPTDPVADLASVPASLTPDSQAHDWVIKAPGGFFLRSKDDFVGPWVDQTSAKNAARDALPADIYALWRTSKGGKNPVPCFLDMDEILHRYGTSPQYQEYSYFAPRSTLSGSVFTQRIARVRSDLEPEFSVEIDRWLGLLAGEHADALRDYLATIDRLDRGTCAVLIQGKKGVGKDLFAAGIASLWNSTPTPFKDAVSEFNPGLMRGPVVFANESLSVSKYLGETALDALKKLVTNGSHRVADKNVRESKVQGYVRVVLASNNEGIFDFGRIPTPDDLAALQERVLLLVPTDDAAEYLKTIGGMDATKRWIEGGLFARHVLWLRKTRAVTPASRLLVEGRGGLATMITAGSPEARPLLGAVLRALLRRTAAGGQAPTDALEVAYVSEGRVWASGTRLQHAWSTYTTEDKPTDWSDAWNFVCEPGTSQARTPPGRQKQKMRRVRLDVLKADAARRGQADELAAVLAGADGAGWTPCVSLPGPVAVKPRAAVLASCA